MPDVQLLSGFHKVWFAEREIQEIIELTNKPTAYKILAPREEVSIFESADFTIDDAEAPRNEDEKDMAAFIGMEITAPMILSILFVLLVFLFF